MPTDTHKLNDCGKHYGRGGKCSKCAHFAATESARRKGTQYSGTLWVAILEPLEESAQERAIRKAGQYRLGIF